MWGKNVGILFLILSFPILLSSESISKNDNSMVTKSKIQGKVVNGVVVPIEKFPFTAQFLNMGRLCGAAILNSWTIITSAHCLMFNTNTKLMRVITGARYAYDYSGVGYNVSSALIHEDYNKEQTFALDIALIFLESPIEFGPRAQKAVLVDHDKWMYEKETNFIVAGWGLTKENGSVSKVGLQMTSLKYVPPEICSKYHDNYRLSADMFCLYGEGMSDVCQGDSGGGVLWNDVIVGITSHGCGCARKGRPSVYTNLWYVRSWIKKHVTAFYDNHCKERSDRQDMPDINSTELFS